MAMTARLNEVSMYDKEILTYLHHWESEEKERERYTCWPVLPVPDRERFIFRTRRSIAAHRLRIFILRREDHAVPIGKVMAFSYNARNHSAEFGYYLPSENRGCGYGHIMLTAFVSAMFQDEVWDVHKLYATTASGNVPSVRLLKSLGLHLDGVIREHYWFEEGLQDQWHFSLLKREWRQKHGQL